jgi:hypothetical protein
MGRIYKTELFKVCKAVTIILVVLRKKPRMTMNSAATIGTFRIVISPRAWKPYYVCHEMIHHLQNEKLGMINAWRKPKCFIADMAYSPANIHV